MFLYLTFLSFRRRSSGAGLGFTLYFSHFVKNIIHIVVISLVWWGTERLAAFGLVLSRAVVSRL